MFNSLIQRKMDGYLRQAELVGDMRNAWLRHVWWTREAAIAIINNLPSTQSSVAKLLTNPMEMGDIWAAYYSDRTVKKIEDLFTTHLKQGGDIITAATQGDMQKVDTLTKQWYANADEIAKFMASINPYYSEAEVRRMMYEHLRLTLMEVTDYIQGRFDASIAAFDKIQKEALEMADYFAFGLIKQFPEKFR